MTDDSVTVTEIREHELPFGRRVRLLDVDYHNGLHMLRMIWREGKRITQIEIDPASAAALGDDIRDWAETHAPKSEG